ncbi:MAG: glycosyltransferase family 39 protein [Candidatus Levybacteria bacterium]|nr:glycosyltransferase family 39 protein [Candidatus Levybacteria bacterium]
MMAVKGILYDHHQTLIGPATSLRGVFQGPLWYYLLALSTAIFGGDPWGGIALMFIISISVLLVVYFWMRNLFGEKAALISLFLFAVSPEAIAAATYAWNPHPMWLLIVIYIFTFYSAIYKSNKFNIVLWPTIGLMFHFQTALAVFILLSTIIYIFIFQRKIFLNKNLLIGLGIFSITFLPQVIFDLRHNFLMSKSAMSLFSGSERGLFVGGEKTGYLKIVADHIFAFYNNFKSAFINDGIAKYVPDLLILLILLTTLIVMKKNNFFSDKESRFFSLVIKLLSIIFLLSLAYPFPLRYWFLTGFQSFYLIALGLLLSRFLTDRLGKVILIALFILLTSYSFQRINILYFSPPDDGGAEKIKGKLAAIDHVYKDAKDKNFNLLVFTPAVYTDAYDYLIWWHGGEKYNYIPGKEKTRTFYLLIEKDRSKPWSYNGWLETVIRTGNIVETITLPSGLIVQKRSM